MSSNVKSKEAKATKNLTLKVEKGETINFKDGKVGIIVGWGMSDFIGDPYPIYVQILGTTERCVVMSNELKLNIAKSIS